MRENLRSVLGIDIGGTKISAQLFEVDAAGTIEKKCLWAHEEPSHRGLKAHVAQMVSILLKALNQGHVIIGAGIGSPGRFAADGRIKAGTHENMSLAAGEFNSANLKEHYQEALAMVSDRSATLPIIVGNDANAMLAGMLESLLKSGGIVTDSKGRVLKLYGKTIAVFGIGTGIGHAIVHLNISGEFHFVTDGHASKLRIAVDAEDLTLLNAAKARLELQTGKEEVRLRGQALRRAVEAQAEDLFRGPVICALADVQSGQEIVMHNPGHLTALRFAGKYMARTIASIKTGDPHDIDPAHEWSQEDKKQAAQTHIYLIGGGMGSSNLGPEIIRYAEDELSTLGIADVSLIQVAGENFAVRAAATMVPESLRRL